MIEQEYYTKKEMIASAKSEGFTVTQSLFEDWQDKGLVWKAEEKRYPGRGSVARWSYVQHMLFLSLLRARETGNVKKIRGLCNIPVGWWLYWGDMKGVCLEQVKRAMKTWVSDTSRAVFPEEVRRNTAELVGWIASPHARGRREFLADYTKSRMSPGHPFPDEETLTYHLKNIIDPSGRNEARGVSNEHYSMKWSVEAVVQSIRSRPLAAKHLAEFPDEIWHWAATHLQMKLAGYQEALPELRSHPDLKDLPDEDMFTSMGSSCLNLLIQLGSSLDGNFWAKHPPYMRPQLWKEKKVGTIVERVFVPSPLVSQHGTTLMHPEIHIHVLSKDGGQWFGKITTKHALDPRSESSSSQLSQP